MPKYLAEFIGTFFLVATIGFAVLGAPLSAIWIFFVANLAAAPCAALAFKAIHPGEE